MAFTTNVTVNWDSVYTGTLKYGVTNQDNVQGTWSRNYYFTKFQTRRTGSVYHYQYNSTPWLDDRNYNGIINNFAAHSYYQGTDNNNYRVTGNWKLTHSVTHSGGGPVVGPYVVPDESYSIGIYGSYQYRDIRFAVANF